MLTMVSCYSQSCKRPSWPDEAHAALRAKDCEAALKVLEGVAPDKKVEFWYLTVGNMGLRCSGVDATETYLARAEAALDEGIRRYPRSAGLLYWSALLAEKRHDAGDTARKFEMARLLAETLIVENRNPGEAADGRNVVRMLELNQRPAWPRQARQALAAGQCEQALQLLGELAEADRTPQWYVMSAEAGGTCWQKGDVDAGERALVVLAEGERRYPRNADIRYSHWSLLITMTRYAEAERELRETMALAEELIRTGEDATTVSQARRVLAVMRGTEAAKNRRP